MKLLHVKTLIGFRTGTRMIIFLIIPMPYSKLHIKFSDWLNVQGRITNDDSFSHFETRNYASTQATVAGPNGGYGIGNRKSDSFYADILLSVNKNVSQDINISGTVGFSHQTEDSAVAELIQYCANIPAYPNFFSVYALNGLFNKSEYLNKTAPKLYLPMQQ